MGHINEGPDHLTHFSVSSAMSLPKSAGEPDSVLDRWIVRGALLLRIRRLEPTRQDASTAIASGLRLLQKIKSPTNNSPVIAVLSGKPSALRAAVRVADRRTGSANHDNHISRRMAMTRPADARPRGKRVPTRRSG